MGKLEDDLKRKDNEIQRLRLLEQELETLRKAYKQVITRTQETTNVSGGGAVQGIKEANLLLMR